MLGLLLLGCVGSGIAAAETRIPDAEVEALRLAFESSRNHASLVTLRRECKRVVRRAEALLATAPEAANRFEVVDLLFQGRKRLLAMENTPSNRDALFGICEQLSEAPDDYAETRLEADLLLTEREHARTNADTAERVEALKAIVARYRGTPAERRSLTIATMIAAKLQAFDLHEELRLRLASSSFGGDHEALAMRRRTYRVDRLDAVFSGTYSREGGPALTFPHDRLGHQYLVIFWSNRAIGFDVHDGFLKQIKEQQDRFPGQFEIYSMNLDSLPDAGLSNLRRRGIKATALHLPRGRSDSAYGAYALDDPVAIFVNAQGHTTLRAGRVQPWPGPTPARGKSPARPGPGLGMWLDSTRYTAQLSSLFIGDFLVSATVAPSARSEALQEILSCFASAPTRYRLTREAALAQYRRAEALCSRQIKAMPAARDLWAIRNCRIIALLGLWNTTADAGYLDAASEEARVARTAEAPPGRDVAPRFCLARAAMRDGEVRPEAVLNEFVGAVGGESASARALAAAAILAIEANEEEAYRSYRERLLALGEESDPSLWPVLTFMRDPQHDMRLFWSNPGRWGHSRRQRYNAKYEISGLGTVRNAGAVLKTQLKTLAGEDLQIPLASTNGMTGLVFAEPPREGAERAAWLARLQDHVAQFTTRDVPTVVAFLSDDTNVVQSVLAECDGAFQAAIVPGGLTNPLCSRLGILSADRIPNPFLLLEDGRIAWSVAGHRYPIHGGSTVEGVVGQAIGINVEKARTDRAFAALDRGEFEQALVLFDARVPPKMKADPWTADRLQGRALAHMGLGEWDAALTDIDAAIVHRKKGSRYGRRVYPGNVEMRQVRIRILKHLGREEEAADEAVVADRDLAWLAKSPPPGYPPSYARNGIPVGVFDDVQKRVRLRFDSASP